MRAALVSFLFLWFAIPGFTYSWPPQNKSAAELTEGSATRFVSEKEKNELREAVIGGDPVLIGRIQGIVLVRAGAGNPPLFMPQVTFQEISMLKGNRPQELTFSYAKSPESLKFPKGAKVIVILKRFGGITEGYKITALAEANQTNLKIVKEATA